MNETPEKITQCSPMSGVCDKLSKLTDLTLKGDYDLTLQLLDSPSDSALLCWAFSKKPATVRSKPETVELEPLS